MVNKSLLLISIKDVGKTFQSLLAWYANVAVNGVMCNGWHCLVDLSVMQKCEGIEDVLDLNCTQLYENT